MAAIVAHIRVHPGREAEFETVARALYRDTHASERGVRLYEYWRGEEPGLYYGLLAFDDFDAFLAHQTSAHHEAAAPALGALIRELRLEWADPVGGASPLGPTRGQPLAPGADAKTARYHRIFAAQVQAWWEALRTGA